MPIDKNSPPIKEAVGIFFDVKNLREAIDELISSGFDRSELGLLAGEYTVQQALGELYTKTNEFADSPNAPRTAFVARESIGDTMHALLGSLFFVGATATAGAAVASAAVLGGALLAATSGALAISTIGAVMALIIRQSDADYLEEQVDEGHLLLFVRTRDFGREKRAAEILSKHNAFDVKIYSVPAVSSKID